MRKFAAAAALGCALISVLATGATAGKTRMAATPAISWGVADDSSKYSDDGGKWFYGAMNTENLTTNRWTLAWNPSSPTAITELPFIQRAAPVAQAHGIHVILSLYAGTNGTSSPDAAAHDPAAFCSWAKLVAQTVKQWGIDSFIIWNEPSSTLYWTPQKDSGGNDVAASAYEGLLANCYDQLHSLDGGGWTADVIGMGLSAKASKNTSNEPLTFLRDVGAAYKATTRSNAAGGTPIMDQLSLHPYPLPATNPSPDKGYDAKANPADYGPPDLARVKQAVYDAFNGTAQPTTVSATNPLTFVLDEFGWQTKTAVATDFSATDALALANYTGTENAGPPGSAAAVTEATQATYLEQAIAMFACDPTVTDVNLFLLVDEADRSGWQSGLMTTGGEGKSLPKLAYAASADLFAAGRDACTTGLTTFTPLSAGGSSGKGGSGGSGKGSGGSGKGSGGTGKGSGGTGKGSGGTGSSSGFCTKTTKLDAGYACWVKIGAMPTVDGVKGDVRRQPKLGAHCQLGSVVYGFKCVAGAQPKAGSKNTKPRKPRWHTSR